MSLELVQAGQNLHNFHKWIMSFCWDIVAPGFFLRSGTQPHLIAVNAGKRALARLYIKYTVDFTESQLSDSALFRSGENYICICACYCKIHVSELMSV